jgi:predicted RNA binding protein YcfA (HicA-like mRNA interferase family)
MTPRLPVCKSSELVRVVIKLGFHLDRQKGSHAIYIRDADQARVVIPMHKGKDIKPKTLKGILEDIKITIDEFRKLLVG